MKTKEIAILRRMNRMLKRAQLEWERPSRRAKVPVDLNRRKYFRCGSIEDNMPWGDGPVSTNPPKLSIGEW